MYFRNILQHISYFKTCSCILYKKSILNMKQKHAYLPNNSSFRIGFIFLYILRVEPELKFLITLYTTQCFKTRKLPNLFWFLIYLHTKNKVGKCIANQNFEILKFDNDWQLCELLLNIYLNICVILLGVNILFPLLLTFEIV